MSCYDCIHSKLYYGCFKYKDEQGNYIQMMFCNKKEYIIGRVEECKDFIYLCYESKKLEN